MISCNQNTISNGFIDKNINLLKLNISNCNNAISNEFIQNNINLAVLTMISRYGSHDTLFSK